MVTRENLMKAQRIVVKVGTSTLTYTNGKLNLSRIESLVRQIVDLHNSGKEMILVSSGAIGVGADRMGFKRVPRTIPEKQALAAIGQGALLHMYEKIFAEYGKTVAQVLLTRDDFMERMRYLNATNALLAILSMQVIPIINENDTVVVEEIKFGDNDTLSAMVAGITDAELLIILSDVDGLYDSDPRLNSKAALQKTVTEITEEMEINAGTKGSSFSSGGMTTKLNAARICMAEGVPMVIANSSYDDVIRRIVNAQDIGTLFVPREEKMQARKRWIAFGSATQGKLYIDAGALTALVNRGKSLLPSGILKVEDEFDRGAVVAVMTEDEQEIAKGMVNYSSQEIKLIAGHKTSEIEKILSVKDYDEVIHRNNLWVK
ncbi:MAG: glutamate 5-kinase [Syntrophomonadaceae bacterium]|jgi:glutamate 5-kinase|nr:glutamate 5-kinase [Syntrophomonadaceae bacterium]